MTYSSLNIDIDQSKIPPQAKDRSTKKLSTYRIHTVLLINNN